MIFHQPTNPEPLDLKPISKEETPAIGSPVPIEDLKEAPC